MKQWTAEWEHNPEMHQLMWILYPDAVQHVVKNVSTVIHHEVTIAIAITVKAVKL